MCKQESLAWLVPLPMPAIFFALRGIARERMQECFLARGDMLNGKDMYTRLYLHTPNSNANRFVLMFVHVLAYRHNFYRLLKSQCHRDNFLVNGLMLSTLQRCIYISRLSKWSICAPIITHCCLIVSNYVIMDHFSSK